MKQELTMDMLMKIEPEVFRDIMKNQDLGFNTNLSNLLKMQYEQCSLIKDSYVKILSDAKMPEEDRKEYSRALKDIYLCMQLIEDRFTILGAIIKEQSI